MSLFKTKILIIIIFILINSIIYLFTTKDKEARIETVKKQQISYLENNYKVSLDRFNVISTNVFNTLINREDVLKLFYQAKYAKSENELKILREQMFVKTSPHFERLRDIGAKIMLFSFQNNKTFLRVHKPKKYDDDLSEVRYSFTYVNDKQKILRGFEEGKISHAFRNIFPIYYNDEFLGSIDIAFSSEAVQDNMTMIHGIHTHFILNKNIFDTKIWKAQKEVTYTQSIENEDFLYALTNKQIHSKITSQEEIDLNNALQEKIKENLTHNSSFSLLHTINGTLKIITFMPIKNIKENKTVAYIVSYVDCKSTQNTLFEYLLINILSFLTLLILSYFIYQNIKQRNSLQIEVDKKTKDLQVEIEKQNRAFTMLFEKPADGILILENNIIIKCNEAALNMLGYISKEEMINIHPSILSPKFQPDGSSSFTKIEEMINLAIKKGSHNFEWVQTRDSGEDFWTEITLTPVSLVDKDIIHVTWKDISDRKALEKQVEHYTQELENKIAKEVKKNKIQQEQMFSQSRLAQMGEMISMIAHQWRQPLGAISSTAIDLQLKIELEAFDLSKVDDRNKFEKYFTTSLKNISEFVHNLTTTIDDFRNFYKPDKQFNITSVNSTIQKSLNIIQASFDSDKIDVIKKFESKAEINLFDHEMMHVFLNILKNAQDNFLEKKIKAPKIEIKTYDTDINVIIEITDNGGGIPEDIIDKIFDPYFSTKSAKNGTGLGLHMSKTVVEDHHNGILNVENLNDGIKFTIIIHKINI